MEPIRDQNVKCERARHRRQSWKGLTCLLKVGSMAVNSLGVEAATARATSGVKRVRVLMGQLADVTIHYMAIGRSVRYHINESYRVIYLQ